MFAMGLYPQLNANEEFSLELDQYSPRAAIVLNLYCPAQS
jgi:hypothetical protein